MSALESEVYHAVEELLTNIKGLAEKTPEALIRNAADDFNGLLAAAKKAVSGSNVITEIKELKQDDAVLTMMARLSALHGAMKGARHDQVSRQYNARR